MLEYQAGRVEEAIWPGRESRSVGSSVPVGLNANDYTSCIADVE